MFCVFEIFPAEIKANGVFKEVVLVDEAVTLKKIRPFLFLIWKLENQLICHTINLCAKDREWPIKFP